MELGGTLPEGTCMATALRRPDLAAPCLPCATELVLKDPELHPLPLSPVGALWVTFSLNAGGGLIVPSAQQLWGRAVARVVEGGNGLRPQGVFQVMKHSPIGSCYKLRTLE